MERNTQKNENRRLGLSMPVGVKMGFLSLFSLFFIYLLLLNTLRTVCLFGTFLQTVSSVLSINPCPA